MYYIVVAVEHVVQQYKYGDTSKKDPPVPIPNTDVKLLSAEDSEGFPFVKAGRRQSFIPEN